MENEQTQKYQNFISAQNFPEDAKRIPESEFYTRGSGGKINYSYAEALLFV